MELLFIPLMLVNLVVYAAVIACMIIATVSLFRIARSFGEIAHHLGELVGKFDDLKRELEGKGKE
jgi:hypothetical protein